MISKYSLISKANLIPNKCGADNNKCMYDCKNCLNSLISLFGSRKLFFLHVDRMKWFSEMKNSQYESENNIQCALRYYEGRNVKKDYKKSFYYYNLAAKQGNSLAHFALGLFYYCGIGIDKMNKNESFKHFKYAAINNNAKAQYCYGICLVRGDGVRINLLKGIRYFRISAENGYDEAQCTYGRCLYEGIGVGKNIYEAKKFFKKSIGQGNKKANFFYDLCMNHKICPKKYKLSFNNLK